MTDAAIARPVTAAHPGDGWRLFARGLGQLLITAGVVILLFVGYELWFTGIYTAHAQSTVLKQLQLQWKSPASPSIDQVKLGDGVAVLYVPRLGRHYHFVVVEGTDHAQLEKGPGHYPGTAMPGELGNFSVAGHRTTYLHPFGNIDHLRPGDAIVLETRTTWFTYQVENIPGTRVPWREIVSPTSVAVAYPVPDQPDPNKRPTKRLLTFTSCNPKYSAAQRIVVHALLVDSRPRSLGSPPALIGEGVS